LGNLLNDDVPGVLKTQGERVPAQKQLHRVAHRGNLFDGNDRPRRDTHLKQPVAQRPLPANLQNAPTAANAQLPQSHTKTKPFSGRYRKFGHFYKS
jgi:hypothetical protein